MKIVHLCLACFFPDNFSYQENLLPKYHKQMGYDVEVIASLQSFDSYGKACYLNAEDYKESYINENDIKVTRLDYKKPYKIYKKMKRFVGLENALTKAKPDILFIHGCQFLDSDVVVRYIRKHKDIIVYVDNHADFSNSASNTLSLNILHKFIWKNSAHKLLPYVKKFYGVLPARVDFLINIYKIPTNKVELLVMGAEDEKVETALDANKRNQLRRKYSIEQDDFLVVFGGKIDTAKMQVLLLMAAVNNIAIPNVKLIVFGSVVPELQKKVEENCSSRVQYIGWVDSAESYNYFGMGELVCFPGRHSVFWEQVAGMGIPMLVKYWPGTNHVDKGGNVEFLYEDSEKEIAEKIKHIYNYDTYMKMKKIASTHSDEFMYSEIAKKSIAE